MATKNLTCAETAKLLRSALKAQFPHEKFSVRSHVYAGGASINVSWTDGSTIEEVEKIAGRYNGATFDGQIDLKSYHSDLVFLGTDELPTVVNHGADFVFTNRELSPQFRAQLAERAQEILSFNQDTQGETFDLERWNYPPLGTRIDANELGFRGGSGWNLVYHLSNFVAPVSVSS